mmetsp:Transcript_27565/g.36604  ORF Transcript_27565/g.36604 Transcript_27565/m.36604 type:complete len:80 (-) Transcript_27565:626-865(-)
MCPPGAQRFDTSLVCGCHRHRAMPKRNAAHQPGEYNLCQKEKESATRYGGRADDYSVIKEKVGTAVPNQSWVCDAQRAR